MKKTFEIDFAGRHLSVETGEIAKQADGAALVRFGETVTLSTAVASDKPRDGDFFPLTVDYIEKCTPAEGSRSPSFVGKAARIPTEPSRPASSTGRSALFSRRASGTTSKSSTWSSLATRTIARR